MNRKIFTSLLIIGMVFAAMGGATLAWFTAEETIDQNVFQAGTVSLDVDDSWEAGTHETVDNWNPGDCDPKEVDVEYTGTKTAYLRVLIEEEWLETDGKNEDTQKRDIANVRWKNGDGDDWDYDEWVMIFDGDDYWWYYIGLLGPDDVKDINVLSMVCLDGPTTGNEYQGAKYTIDMKFQVIQASHEAVFTQWDVGYVNGNYDGEDIEGWYVVTVAGGGHPHEGKYVTVAEGKNLYWDPTGSAVPNYTGWTFYTP